jgi:hypothetical protein
MGKGTIREPGTVVEIDRIDATGFRELAWSDGRRLRFSTFLDSRRPTLTAAERAARREITRRRKMARRRKGEGLKATLAAYRKQPPS